MKILGTVGGCITRGPIIFTWDDKYILLAQETTILVLDGETAQLLGRIETQPSEPVKEQGEAISRNSSKSDNSPTSLPAISSPRGHKQPIIALALHPTVPSQVFSASADGTICLWHYEAAHLIHSVRAPERVASLATARGHKTLYVNCTVSTLETSLVDESSKTADAQLPPPKKLKLDKTRKVGSIKKDRGAVILQMDVNDIQQPTPFRPLFETGLGTAMSTISANGKYFIFSRSKSIIFWNVETDPQHRNVVSFDVGFEPTRLALHPHQPQAYWTNGTGSIFIKRFDQHDNAMITSPPSKLHWHAHAALTINPSLPDGLYLLSGGEEGVVVSWQLSTSNRQFIPYLGSSVLRVASNHSGSLYAALLRSNSLILITPGTLSICARYDALPYRAAQRNASHIGLVADPRHPSALLLNGSLPGSVVSYDPLRDKVRLDQEIDVCEQNYIGKGNRPLTYSDVVNLATSSDGRWMATFDQRLSSRNATEKGDFEYLEMLRFWRRKQGKYVPYASIASPHFGPITKLFFAPGRIESQNKKKGHYMCLTLATDGRVRVWKSLGCRILGQHKKKPEQILHRASWVCVDDLEKSNLVPRAGAFHPNGKYFAIAFDHMIVIYETNSLKPKGDPILVKAQKNVSFREIAFIGDYLIAIDGECLFSWYIKDCDKVWNHPEQWKLKWGIRLPNCQGLTVQAALECFAILVHPIEPTSASSSLVLIFRPNHRVPLYGYGHKKKIQAVNFVRLDWQEPPVLAIIDERGKMLIFSLDGISDTVLLPINPASAIYQERQHGLAKSLIRHPLVNPDERLRSIDLTDKVDDDDANDDKRRPIPIFPRVNSDIVLMSQVPSHRLPQTLETFYQFIKFKFPEQVIF